MNLNTSRKQVVCGFFILLLSSCTSAEVDMVKSGSLSMCSNHTLEEMVDGLFGSPSWDSGASDDGMTFVNVSGDMTFSGKEVTGMLQFTVDDKNQTFQYRAFEINDMPQNNFMAGAVLKKMCASAVSSSGVLSDYKKAEITSNIKAGVRNIATYEEVYFTDGANGYTSDLSRLDAGKELLEIADVSIKVTEYVYVITAKSKEEPSIIVIYDSEKNKFISN
ncbi:MAG: hypothetical protein R8M45_03175 [Ghiorsea sp.]